MHDEHSIGNIRTKKAMLRRQILEKRRALSKKECEERSKKICETFLASSEYRDSSSILLYKAYNNEVDTDMIFAAATSDGKTVAYPRSKIVDGEPDLSFYVTNDQSELSGGYMGILEPDEGGRAFEGKADICIAPGVVFDTNCHRIGYGKAFYDRFIRMQKPKKVIGLAYDIQMADDFETEDSDRAVDIVITDSAVYRR